MAYDDGLAARVRKRLESRERFTEIKMFGGLCFLVNGNMTCGIVDDRLMVRVGPDQYEEALTLPFVRPMDFTGRPMRGIVYVELEGTQTDAQLDGWAGRAFTFVQTLPPK